MGSKAMSAKRKGDKQTGRSWFRTERLLQDGGKWFFLTREGKVEGPFNCRFDALNRLDTYARIMSTELYNARDESELTD